jgi:putative FmdB family regulatory protein
VPIYEYHCLGCGEAFEKLVFGQASVACPTCRSLDVARELSVFAFRSGATFVGSTGGCGHGCGCGAGG